MKKFLLCIFSLIVSPIFCFDVELLVAKELARSFKYKLEVKRTRSGRSFITDGNQTIFKQDAILCSGSDSVYGDKKYYSVIHKIPYGTRFLETHKKSKWGNKDKLCEIKFLGGYIEEEEKLKKNRHCASFTIKGNELKKRKKVLIITVDLLEEKTVFAINWSNTRSSLGQVPFFNDTVNFISEEKLSIIDNQVADFVEQTIYRDDDSKVFALGGSSNIFPGDSKSNKIESGTKNDTGT